MNKHVNKQKMPEDEYYVNPHREIQQIKDAYYKKCFENELNNMKYKAKCIELDFWRNRCMELLAQKQMNQEHSWNYPQTSPISNLPLGRQSDFSFSYLRNNHQTDEVLFNQNSPSSLQYNNNAAKLTALFAYRTQVRNGNNLSANTFFRKHHKILTCRNRADCRQLQLNDDKDLQGLDLSGALFCQAVLTLARMRDTQLTNTYLVNASLDKVDLTGAKGLTTSQLSKAIGIEDIIIEDTEKLINKKNLLYITSAKLQQKIKINPHGEQANILFNQLHSQAEDLNKCRHRFDNTHLLICLYDELKLATELQQRMEQQSNFMYSWDY